MARYDEPTLRRVIAESFSFSDALRRLGLRAAGGNHATIKKYVELWGISTSHFNYDRAPTHLLRARTPLGEILVERSTYHRGHLKRRLYEEGIKLPRCEMCGQGEVWKGRPMALILDHINGIPNDNRLENLRIVCPNCAATLDTHCGRKNRLQRARRGCLRCGTEFVPANRRQRYCSRFCGQRWDRSGRGRPETRKVERPPYEQLMAEIAATSYLAVGRKYGVSDNAIRKWVRQYERERKSGTDGH
ncbi:MAG TPA: HNH endonuclease signature motif containing protein [Thermoleophilaceae bacterium]